MAGNQLKRYIVYVTFLHKDCPEPWDEFDAMDWDERRPLLDKYSQNMCLSVICPGCERDETVARGIAAVEEANPGWQCVCQSVPAFDGWVDGE